MSRTISHNKITLLNLASTVILQGLAFFTAPLFSNLLGTSNYGIAAVYLTWVQVANTIFTLQSGSIAQARIYFPEEEQAAYQSSVLSLGTFSYLSFSALTLLAVRFLPINVPFPMALLALLQGWGLYCVSFANGKFTYEFKAEENFVLSLLIAFSNVILSLFLIGRFPAEENYWGRILGQSVSYTLIGSVVFIGILIRGKTLYCSRYWRFTLPISIPVIFHLLAHILLNQCDRIMLNSMLNSSVVGIYSLAVTFSTVINTLYSAFNNSWVPFYYEYTKRHEIFNVRKHARNYYELFTVLTMGFILLSREVYHFFAKEPYWPGSDYIPLLALGYYFVFLYSFPVNYEFYHKETRSIAVVTLSAGVCNVILNYILILKIGPIGAVIATAVSHGLQFLFHYFSAKRMKFESDIFPFRLVEALPGLCAVLLAIGITFLMPEVWLFRWGFGAALGIWQLSRIIRRKSIF